MYFSLFFGLKNGMKGMLGLCRREAAGQKKDVICQITSLCFIGS